MSAIAKPIIEQSPNFLVWNVEATSFYKPYVSGYDGLMYRAYNKQSKQVRIQRHGDNNQH